MAGTRGIRTLVVPGLVAAAAVGAVPAAAETARSFNFYGVPGLIDMPGGEAAPDALLSTTVASFAGITRTTLSFQFTERLSGSFRYSRLSDLNLGGYVDYFDRSFDLRFRLVDEGRYVPSVTIGLQDFLGTGLSSAEYIAMTKRFGDRVAVTAGLGWGRFGSYGSIGAPLGERPAHDAGEGGTFNAKSWFRGDAAPFAGVEVAVTDRLTFKAEYSSDAYDLEADSRGLFDRASPLNFGLEYQAGRTFRFGAYYLYGSTIGVSTQITLNPKTPTSPGTLATAPLPVSPRDRQAAESWGTDWTADPGNVATLRRVTAETLARDGIVLEHMRIEGTQVVLHLRNTRFDAEPQAIGRTARALANILPPSVEHFTIVPLVNGVPAVSISMRRTDVERFENRPDGTEAILAATAFADQTDGRSLSDRVPGVYPRFSWSVAPYVTISIFDPRNPILGDTGLRAQARYEPAPGMVISGSLTGRVWGNYDRADGDPSDSVLPHVRSDGILYAQAGDVALEHLTAAYYFRPGRDLYGRVTGGYLERMFGGVSAELLWKRIDSPFAVGIEANYASQRDFDGGFGFQDYSVATGHVSAYWNFAPGYHATVHAGRYLAGDWGATFQLDREFANGWKVGAFATLTDVSAEEFGEGSFDKGIHVEVPLSWVTGQPSPSSTTVILRPLSRDGGQRLNVSGRLYEDVRDYHTQGLGQEWGMFWR